jgi:ankyrin repeat protein
MVALRNAQNISTYSQSQRIWMQAQAHGEPVSSANAKSTQKSLYAALFYADAAQTREHIARSANVNETYDHGMGTLHVAASSGCPDCIAALVDAGAKINYKVPTYREENALMMAIRSRQVAAAQKLLALGADPCQTDREGYDAQGWVTFYGLQSSFDFVPACKK